MFLGWRLEVASISAIALPTPAKPLRISLRRSSTLITHFASARDILSSKRYLKSRFVLRKPRGDALFWQFQ
ncbi:MAG: hypothetical protein OJF49_003657 [Ktedonobacterales bacterium]|nr:MAG: hypothetical protein OJF49_003657 [Ktedonobacterales bacterium]